MANVESANFAAAASPAGALKGTASNGPPVAPKSESAAISLAIWAPRSMIWFLFRSPWYFSDIALSFSTLAGDISCRDDSQRDTRAMAIHTVARILIQRGSRRKSTQAERIAHAATSIQNFIF